ncbi:MAG TPA: TIGR03557 family F420-dependent LLM class oxidoreductase [Thermomicrobiaceae bacterium]|nr:TIGR03557 family F420-dependent LLM class oxidoreductase [Thermomicrobiaceae bacterium]
MIQLGWKAGTEQYEPNELLDYALKAEEAGFDFLDVSDHIQPWSEAGQAAFTWSWLGAVAARTSRIAFGPGVTCPIVRYHPAVIAQAAATLAAMAPDRVYLSLGTGEALNEYAATGSWPGYNERRERLAEAIQLIRALWTGGLTTFNGKYYRTRSLKLWTLPSRPIPIYISTLVPESAAFAAEHGDGLVTVGGKPPQHYQQIMRNFEQAAKQSGKEPATMPRLVELSVAYTSDAEAAIQNRLKYWAGTMVPALFDQKIYKVKMSQENGSVVGPDTIRQKACISDDPEEQRKSAQQYVDLGFDHLIFHSAGPDQAGFIKRFGQDVLPLIRQRQPAGQSADGRRAN